MGRGRPKKQKLPLTEEQKAINRERSAVKKKFLKEEYTRNTSTCCYCEQTAETVYQFVKSSKRSKTRGKNLEVERTKPNETYKASYKNGNLRLACYICNNAKSDFPFTEELFKDTIAKGIREAVTQFKPK